MYKMLTEANTEINMQNTYTAIVIDNLMLALSVGILDHERTAPQNVVISMILKTDAHYIKTATKDTIIDYGAICERLKALENHAHIDLLETLMIKILDIAFSFPSVHDARIKITKPDIIAQAENVGIETVVDRDTYNNTCT